MKNEFGVLQGQEALKPSFVAFPSGRIAEVMERAIAWLYVIFHGPGVHWHVGADRWKLLLEALSVLEYGTEVIGVL